MVPGKPHLNPVLKFGVAVVLIAAGLLYWGWEPVDGGSAADLPERNTRFGIFRDLLLIERPPASGGAFFLDRFETTRADWFYYESATGDGATAAGDRPDAAARDLPVTSISLAEARVFARWRFCRLPRHDELMYASTQGGASQYPWGDRWVETWANTHGLSLGRVAPVGSFESGRSASGPYDLIGNVAEWTESVELPKEAVEILDTSWMRTRPVLGVTSWLPDWSPLPTEWLSMGEGFLPPKQACASAYRVLEMPELPGVSKLSQTVGLVCWLPGWSPRPLEWFIMAEHSEQPRLAFGGDYRTTIGKSPGTRLSTFPRPKRLLAGRKSDTTGLRLAAGPVRLVSALLASGVNPSVSERRLLRRFLAEPKHRRVLRTAWQWLDAQGRIMPSDGGPMAEFLSVELGG